MIGIAKLIHLIQQVCQTAARGSTSAPLSYEMATSHALSTAMIFKHPNQGLRRQVYHLGPF